MKCPSWSFANVTHNNGTEEISCDNCSLFVANCDSCLLNGKVLCLNCTSGWHILADENRCQADEKSFSFPGWGVAIIVIALLAIFAGSVFGYFYWRRKREVDVSTPNVIPDPDGPSAKASRKKDRKRNRYIRDPTTKPSKKVKVNSVYGDAHDVQPEDPYSNWKFRDVNEPTSPEPVSYINIESTRVDKSRPPIKSIHPRSGNNALQEEDQVIYENSKGDIG